MLQDTNFLTNVHVPDNILQRTLSFIVWILSQYHKSFHDGAQRYIYSLLRKPSRQDTDLIWIKLSDIQVLAVNRIKVNGIEKCNLIFGLLNLIYLIHLISYYQYIPFVLNHCIFFILLYLSLTENTTIMYYSEETWQLILIVLIFFLVFHRDISTCSSFPACIAVCKDTFLCSQLCPLSISQQHWGSVGLEPCYCFGFSSLSNHIHRL